MGQITEKMLADDTYVQIQQEKKEMQQNENKQQEAENKRYNDEMKEEKKNYHSDAAAWPKKKKEINEQHKTKLSEIKQKFVEQRQQIQSKLDARQKEIFLEAKELKENADQYEQVKITGQKREEEVEKRYQQDKKEHNALKPRGPRKHPKEVIIWRKPVILQPQPRSKAGILIKNQREGGDGGFIDRFESEKLPIARLGYTTMIDAFGVVRAQSEQNEFCSFNAKPMPLKNELTQF